ncbi:unnamed protein product [Camellia sinensis]
MLALQRLLQVSLCNKVYAQEIEDDKAIDHHELIDEENLELNFATAGRMFLCAIKYMLRRLKMTKLLTIMN